MPTIHDKQVGMERPTISEKWNQLGFYVDNAERRPKLKGLYIYNTQFTSLDCACAVFKEQ